MKKLTLLFLLVSMTVTDCLWAAGNPTLTVRPASMRFECEPGRSYYRTFTVTGTDLTEDLSLTMFGDDLTFLMEQTTITAEEAMAGAQVKVRYAPKQQGEYEARIWVRSSEVTGTVLLKGTTCEVPVVTTSTDAVSLSCFVDGMTSATFDVTGTNMDGTIYLDLDDPSGDFALDRHMIPDEEVEGTTTITVYYRSQYAKSDTATVYISSHDSNMAVVKLYGTATQFDVKRNNILIADVYDITGGEPTEPHGCGLFTTSGGNDYMMNLDAFDGVMSIDLDYQRMTATLSENVTVQEESTNDFFQQTKTVTTYTLLSEDNADGVPGPQGTITGTINEDGSLSFDGFVLITEKTVTVTQGLAHQVVSSQTTTRRDLYRNVRLVEPNGRHCYAPLQTPDPGTAQPMLNISLNKMAQVFIQQQEDTVMVWNLYNMGGCNKIVIDNGFFDWPLQQCGYDDDGKSWYNYTYYRSHVPEGEVRFNVVTYPHHVPGVKGKVTDDGLTWGKTTFGDRMGTWSSDIYENNRLYFADTQEFEFQETVWVINDVTRLIDGILADDIDVLIHPASDMNDDGDVNITDISTLIDRLLHPTR